MASWIRWPLMPLVLFSLGSSLLIGVAIKVGIEFTEDFEFLLSVFWLMLIWNWMVSDARDRRLTPCFDFGLLVGFYVPVTVVWYCFWSRGWRGAGTLGALYGLLLWPLFVSACASLVSNDAAFQ